MNTIPWNHPYAAPALEMSSLPAPPAGYDWYHVISFFDHLLALGTTTGGDFITAKLSSLDGAWTVGTPVASVGSPSYVTRRPSDGMYAFIASSSTDIYTSMDGLSWTGHTTDLAVISPYEYFDVGSAGNYFYIGRTYHVGYYRNSLSRSTNVTNWTVVGDITAGSWQIAGAPVALGTDVFVPMNDLSAPTSNPYSIYNGVAWVQGEQSNDSGYDDVDFGPMYSHPAGGVIGGVVPATNSLELMYKAGAEDRFVRVYSRFYNENSSVGWSEEFSLGFWLPSSPWAWKIFGPCLDDEGGIRFVEVYAPDTALYEAWLVDHSFIDNKYTGPLDNAPVLIGRRRDDSSMVLVTGDVTLPAARPDINITTFPTAVTGVVGNVDGLAGWSDMDVPVARQNYRAGCAVFQVTVPPGTTTVVMQFAKGSNPDSYTDIFAGQGMTYDELVENYNAPFYGWFWENEEDLHTQSIPVEGTETLTIVMTLWDVTGEDGKEFNVSFSALNFWSGLTNCEVV